MFVLQILEEIQSGACRSKTDDQLGNVSMESYCKSLSDFVVNLRQPGQLTEQRQACKLWLLQEAVERRRLKLKHVASLLQPSEAMTKCGSPMIDSVR